MALIPLTLWYTAFCSIVPCDFVQTPPGSFIESQHYTNRTTSRGERILKNPYPVAYTNYGKIRGYSMGSVQGNQIFAFEGVRYGEYTGGRNRFKPPVPAKSWKGIRSAFKPGSACLQIHPLFVLRVYGSEDCLFLNIYTTNLKNKGLKPEDDDSPKLPVIIFFHGGSFIFGEGSEYGPAYLVDQNLILVTVNYRLGVLGFMSTGDEASPGNYGLKDQALAMKWVHENIKYFGGDPGKVTLMGQSAGSASVHLHYLSNTTRDYFQGGVGLSAGVFQYWTLTSAISGKRLSNRLARIVGCPTENTKHLVQCFNKLNPNVLVGSQQRLLKYTLTPPVLFSPVVEPKNKNAFVTDTAEVLYERDEVAKYPLMSNMVEDEGWIVIFVLRIFLQTKTFRRNFEKYLPYVLGYDELVEDPSNITEKIQNFYFGTESPETVPDKYIVDFVTDRYFTQGHVKGLKSHAQIAPTYSYLFKYKGRFNFWRLIGVREEEFGVGHIEDAFYFFNSSRYYEGFRKEYPEYKLSQILINMISNFASKREPLYTTPSGRDVKIWKPVEPNKEVVFLEVDKELKMIENPFVDRILFWESLGLNDTTPFKPRGRIKT